MQTKELKSYGMKMNLMFQNIPKYHLDIIKKIRSRAMSTIRNRFCNTR